MKKDDDASMNVSSVIITAAPGHVEEISCILRRSGLCEVFLQDACGRIVVTIEGRDVGEEMRKLMQIQQIEHVVAADLAFSYSEHEVMEDLGHVERRTGPVPDRLKSRPGEGGNP